MPITKIKDLDHWYEYGAMQAYAEGFALLEGAEYGLDLAQVGPIANERHPERLSALLGHQQARPDREADEEDRADQGPDQKGLGADALQVLPLGDRPGARHEATSSSLPFT